MKVDRIRLRLWVTSIPSAAGLLLMACALTTGCAEKAVEKTPEQFEQAREKHFEMMRQESGQAPTAAGQK
ncbi:MAG: hypothetical protein C0485_16875 [Pirellula sp.]|nr:hypothetical protein [Pirellula sp.]